MTPVPVTSSPQHQFPCAQCGANLQFEPGTESLKCPYCGMVQPIPSVPEHIRELDFLTYLQSLPAGDGVHEALTVHCGNCGAETGLQPDVTAANCPFCGCGIVATASTKKSIRPQGLLPFKVTRDQSSQLFRGWVGGLWFAPAALKKQAECAAIHGVYVPAWTYDSLTDTDYTGERGDDYWETETYTETDAQGNTVTRTRQVQRTRWWPASGHVRNAFDDILVMATRTLPPKHLNHLQPWDLPALLPYADEYLSGFIAESYQVALGEGFEQAKGIMQPVINSTICRDIGGDHQRISSSNVNYHDITFKHLLLPVWISAYQFQGKPYRFLVNARTGEVQGERPWSRGEDRGSGGDYSCGHHYDYLYHRDAMRFNFQSGETMSFRFIKFFRAIILLSTASYSVAQIPPEKTEEIDLHVQAAALVTPSLKYRLYPDFFVQVSGDAGPIYREAFAKLEMSEEERNALADIANAPFDKFSLDDADKILTDRRDALALIDKAGLNDHCDWGVDLRDWLKQPMTFLNGARRATQLVSLKARTQMRRGQIADAIKTLKSGFALTHHLSGRASIQGLVATGLNKLLLLQVVQLEQLPDAPNLYWALADIPRPLVNLRTMIDVDAALLRMVPVCDGRDPRTIPSEEYRKWLDGIAVNNATDAKEVFTKRLDYAVEMGKIWPIARAYLESHGYSREAVNDMPMERAVGIFFVEDAQSISDDARSLCRFEYWDMPRALVTRLDAIERRHFSNPIETLAPSVIPCANSSKVNKCSPLSRRWRRSVISRRRTIINCRSLWLTLRMCQLQSILSRGNYSEYESNGNTATLRAAHPVKRTTDHDMIYHVTIDAKK